MTVLLSFEEKRDDTGRCAQSGHCPFKYKGIQDIDNLMESICHIYTNHNVRANTTTLVEIQYSPSTTKTSKEDFHVRPN